MIKPSGLANITKVVRSVFLVRFDQLAAGSGFHGLGLTFSLSDLISSAEFTALFDQYKFDKVVIHILPTANTALMTQSVSFPLVTAIDYDDSTAPTSEDYLLQYENNMITRSFDELHRTIVPRIALGAFQSGGLFNGYANAGNQWIDAASPNVNHYGLKLGINQAYTSTGVASFNIYADYHISFRSLR
jgi:hypothetical protein